MKDKFNIRKNTDCLSREEIELFIDNKLPMDLKQAIDLHIAECELCREAIEGARHFSFASEYTQGLEDLRSRRLNANFFSFERNGKLYAVLAIAASVLILASIISLLKVGDTNTQSEMLAYSEDSGEQINSVIESEGIIIRSTVISESSESEKRNIEMCEDYKDQTQSSEQTIPLAQLENTAVYANEIVTEDEDVIKPEKLKEKKSNSAYLKYPFRVMGNAPASLQMSLPEEEEVPDELFMVVEDMPRFNNSTYSGFLEFIHSKLKYPTKAQEAGVSGRVYVQFTVLHTGEISNIKVLKSANALLDDEVMRVVKLSPLWEPGRQRGVAVDVSLVVPVDFILIQ